MDGHKIVEILRATLQPDQREQAEQQLNEVSVKNVSVPISIAQFQHGDCQKL